MSLYGDDLSCPFHLWTLSVLLQCESSRHTRQHSSVGVDLECQGNQADAVLFAPHRMLGHVHQRRGHTLGRQRSSMSGSQSTGMGDCTTRPPAARRRSPEDRCVPRSRGPMPRGEPGDDTSRIPHTGRWTPGQERQARHTNPSVQPSRGNPARCAAEQPKETPDPPDGEANRPASLTGPGPARAAPA